VKPHQNTLSQRTVTVHQAVQNSAALGSLAMQVAESTQRLKAIDTLLPDSMRSAVKAGPINGDSWCLLVTSTAAAAKLRQLAPLIQARLLSGGWKVTSIRVKILMPQRA
jgi:hypothetical protein